MRTIAFYLSNHGFGHASRNIPIIEELLEREDDLRIIVKCGKNQIQFISESLERYSPKITYYEINNDIGLVLKEGNIDVDKAKLYSDVKKFIGSWDERINEEIQFLKDNYVGLVISDITPWIFKSCNISGIKSVFVSNFTWVEIYRRFLNSTLCDKYLECYKMADYAFIYPFSTEEAVTYFKNIEYVGLVCRKFNVINAEFIKNSYKNPLVYISVGRSVDIKRPIDLEGLPYNFIYTEGIELQGSNTIKIPMSTLNTQDYILAADYVITKAGWSTVSEAVCARKPMLVLRRDEVVEDETTLKKLVEMDVVLPIRGNELNPYSIQNLLCQLEKKRDNYKNLTEQYMDCSKLIVDKILKLK